MEFVFLFIPDFCVPFGSFNQNLVVAVPMGKRPSLPSKQKEGRKEGRKAKSDDSLFLVTIRFLTFSS
jgi:hypothetical protein